MNAALGTVDGYVLKPTTTRRRVLAVGAGPAGLEAARRAAARGHDVTLCERSQQLGGLLPLATMVKVTETEDSPAVIDYLVSQVARLGVTVEAGKEAGPALLREKHPDVVVIATGGTYTVPGIPGIDRKSVLTSEELARRSKLPLRVFGLRLTAWLTDWYLPIGKRVVVLGGWLEGIETAEFLVTRGRTVTVLEQSGSLGEGMPPRFQETSPTR